MAILCVFMSAFAGAAPASSATGTIPPKRAKNDREILWTDINPTSQLLFNDVRDAVGRNDDAGNQRLLAEVHRFHRRAAPNDFDADREQAANAVGDGTRLQDGAQSGTVGNERDLDIIGAVEALNVADVPDHFVDA